MSAESVMTGLEPPAPVARVGVVGTMNYGSPLSLAIAFASRERGQVLAPYCHVLLRFRFADAGLEDVIHEALLTDGYREKPAEWLDVFAARRGRRVTAVWLDELTEEQRLACWMISRSWVDEQRAYPFGDLLGLYLAIRVGKRLNLTLGDDPTRLHCCEAVARALWGATSGRLDLRDDVERDAFDYTTPAMVMRNLMSRINARAMEQARAAMGPREAEPCGVGAMMGAQALPRGVRFAGGGPAAGVDGRLRRYSDRWQRPGVPGGEA